MFLADSIEDSMKMHKETNYKLKGFKKFILHSNSEQKIFWLLYLNP